MAFGALRGFWTNITTSLVSGGTTTLNSASAVSGAAVNNVAVGDLIIVIASGQDDGGTSYFDTEILDDLGNTNPTSQPTGGYHQLQSISWNSGNRHVDVWACRSGFAGNLTSVTLDQTTSTSDDHAYFIAVFEGELNEQTGGDPAGWLRENNAEQDTSAPFDEDVPTNELGDLIVGWGTANVSTTWTAATVGSPNPIASTLIGNVNNASIVKIAMAYRVQADEADTGLIGFTAGSNPSASRVGALAIIPSPSANLFPTHADLALSSVAPTATLSEHIAILPAAANAVLSTFAPTFEIQPAPEAAQLVLSGFHPTAVTVPPGTYIPAAGQLLFNAQTAVAVVNFHDVLTPEAAQLSLSASTPVLAIRYPSNSMAMTGTATFELVPPLVIYAATREFISQPDDVLPNQPFRGTLQKALRLDRTILNGGGIGQVTLSWGEIELINAEADYDDFIDMYAVDGRRVVLRIGHAGPPFVYDGYAVVFDGSATDWHIAEDVMRIEVRDNTFRLEVPAQPHIYAGTGGLEGSDDLTGKRVPRAWGELFNITPTAVIPAELVYQVNDGEIQSVDNVYDGGVALTPAFPVLDYANSTLLRAASQGPFGGGQDIEAGEFATCIAEGLIRLGGTPQGQVTADVHGLLFRNAFVATHADVIFSLVAPATTGDPGTAPVNIDPQSFDRVNAAQPATIGYYLDDSSEASVADVIADIANSMGGWAGFRGRTGTFEVGIFRDPDEDVPTARYSRIDVVDGTLVREKLPPAFTPPPYRFRVAWSRNWTVQDDLFGAVDAARVAYVSEPYRLARSEEIFEDTILADHPLAQDPPPIEAFFSEEQPATTEADRLLSLYALVPRALYRFTVHSRPFVHEIGEVINLAYPRWGLDDGRNMRIVSVSENTDDNTTELVSFG